jgi:hypothetical protein
MGWSPNYQNEARIYARYILKIFGSHPGIQRRPTDEPRPVIDANSQNDLWLLQISRLFDDFSWGRLHQHSRRKVRIRPGGYLQGTA